MSLVSFLTSVTDSVQLSSVYPSLFTLTLSIPLAILYVRMMVHLYMSLIGKRLMKNSQPFRLDPFIPKFPQAQGNPSREDRMQNQFPDVNFQQSRIIDKTYSNWQNYAGATPNETLFDIQKNIALHEDKYNKDDWCWANGYFMSPLYLQHIGSTVSAPQKVNSVFLH